MQRIFISDRMFIENKFVDGGVVVNSNGKIENILNSETELKTWLLAHTLDLVEIYDYTNLVLMPGLIDSHVHVNEPGRTEWEGYETATKAAAAGGFTTIVDMPLNSIPPTTTVENLLAKQASAEGKMYVDVGFWGGIIPGNEDELQPLLENGVVGFKCFLCPSGVPEFPNVTEDDVELAYEKLKDSNALIAFHAEICGGSEHNNEEEISINENPKHYNTYLKTRPPSLEVNAIDLITRLAVKYNTVRTHIVHLSTAEAIPLIQKCREKIGERLTVETCHHYLTLAAEDVPNSRVDFKCCPPVRDRENRELLWQAVKNGDINMIVSDHSPSTPDIKLLADGPNQGNFLKSWGGISSVQFGLSLFWTNCKKYNLTISDMIRLMCEEPAKLCGYEKRKGKIAIGFDADFVVWDPESYFTITPDNVYFQNKANPYMGRTLNGCIHTTIVRGQIAFDRDDHSEFYPVGTIINRKNVVNENNI